MQLGIKGLPEALAIAKSIANHTGQSLDFNRQCLAEGIANLVGGFFRCLPGSGSLSRSAINYQSGGATRFVGIITAVAVALAVIVLAPLARFVPLAAQRAARVVLEVQPSLLPLLAPVAQTWRVTLIAQGTPLSDPEIGMGAQSAITARGFWVVAALSR